MVRTWFSRQTTHSVLWNVSMTEGADGAVGNSSGGALGSESSMLVGGAVGGGAGPFWRVASCSAASNS
jgi:hypothetical protein